MKKIDYKRKHFIKDLFIPERVINSFERVEFESYDTFSYCIANDLYLVEENTFVFIPIKKMTDYRNMVKIFKETNICERSNIYLVIRDQEILNKVFASIVPNNYSMLIDKDLKLDIGKYWRTENGKEWISKNKVVKHIKIDALQFHRQISEIVSIFNEESIRFFLLDIDYNSFEYMEMKNLHKLKFWVKHLKTWMQSGGGKSVPKGKRPQTIELISSKFVKRIFVSDELVLYMNDKKQKDVWFFDLKGSLDQDGESIPVRKLNILRKYTDLVSNALNTDFKISNWFIIDYGQCKEVQGALNELPMIVGIIDRWLHDF